MGIAGGRSSKTNTVMRTAKIALDPHPARERGRRHFRVAVEHGVPGLRIHAWGMPSLARPEAGAADHARGWGRRAIPSATLRTSPALAIG